MEEHGELVGLETVPENDGFTILHPQAMGITTGQINVPLKFQIASHVTADL